MVDLIPDARSDLGSLGLRSKVGMVGIDSFSQSKVVSFPDIVRTSRRWVWARLERSPVFF